MLTQRKQRHVHRQAQADASSYKDGKSGPFSGDSVHTWPRINLGSFSELIVDQSACTRHTRRPQDEPHIGATSCTKTVTAWASAPWTDAFKDNGWLLKASEGGLVEITETWSKIDSLEKLQIDIMRLIIAHSTSGYFGFQRGKKYPRHLFSFTHTWKLALMHAQSKKVCFSTCRLACAHSRNPEKGFPTNYDSDCRK